MAAITAFHYYRRFLHEWQREVRDDIANMDVYYEGVCLRNEYAVRS